MVTASTNSSHSAELHRPTLDSIGKVGENLSRSAACSGHSSLAEDDRGDHQVCVYRVAQHWSLLTAGEAADEGLAVEARAERVHHAVDAVTHGEPAADAVDDDAAGDGVTAAAGGS